MKMANVILKKMFTHQGIYRTFWSLCRKVLLKINPNTDCITHIHQKEVKLPFSHELPIYLHHHPLYDSLITRLATYLRSREQDLIMVDIGANVGDSILATLPNQNDKYLAIEPSAYFSTYLHHNLHGINYQLVECFLTDKTQQKDYILQESRGTAKLVKNSQSANIQAQSIAYTLDELLITHPQFLSVNFLKIDTDGFDLKILRGWENHVSSLPIVLFECDDFGQQGFDVQLMQQMIKFQQLGYAGFSVYDNFGVLMAQFDFSANDLKHFQNLVQFKLLSRHFYYFDILVYPQKYEDFTVQELIFFAKHSN